MGRDFLRRSSFPAYDQGSLHASVELFKVGRASGPMSNHDVTSVIMSNPLLLQKTEMQRVG